MANNKRAVPSASISPARRNVRVSRIRQVKSASSCELSASARCLLRSLIDYLGESDVCWPAASTLARECGLSVRQVRRILRELESSGWILSSARRRADGGQTSSLLSWRRTDPADVGELVPASSGVTPPPDMGDTPIENSGNTKKQHAACGLNSGVERKSPRTPQDAPGRPSPAQDSPAQPDSLHDVPAAPAEHPDLVKSDGGPVPAAFGVAAAQILKRCQPVVVASADSFSSTPPAFSSQSAAAPAIPAAPARGRWVVFDAARLADGRYLLECHARLVSAGLLLECDAVRLRFCACWLEVLRRYRLGRLRNPCAVLRWLLENPRVMAQYPTAASENKARSVLRRADLSAPAS